MAVVFAWFAAHGVTFLAGAAVMWTGGTAAKWLAKQFGDAKSHIPSDHEV